MVYVTGCKLNLKIDLWQMTLHVQIINVKTANFNVNFYQGWKIKKMQVEK